MAKEFEIQGCVEVPISLHEDEFYDEFIGFIESRNWSFGGGINEIIDGFYINADGTKGKHVLWDAPNNVHDNVANELFWHHSLSALVYLINAGRELEFSYNGVKCFISKSGSAKTVSLWISELEQAYDSIEDLTENALICNLSFMHIFHATTLETLF